MRCPGSGARCRIRPARSGRLLLGDGPGYPSDLADRIGVSRQILSNHLACYADAAWSLRRPSAAGTNWRTRGIAHALDDSAVSSAAAVAWQFAAKDPETREKAAVRFIACSFLALAAIYRQFGHPREGVGPPKLLAHRQSDRPAGRAGRPRAWCWTLTVTGVSPRGLRGRSRPARSERTCPTAPASRRAGTAIHRPRPSGRSAAPSV
jgi:hypothetical protein